jgi:hypothetical protein
MATRQLNIRLAPSALDELETHAFLRRVSPTVMARGIILEYLRRAREEPGFIEAMRARAEHDQQDHQNTVRPLHPR